MMSISFRGRTTERAYPQPVSYVHDGDTLLTPAGGKWKLNHRRSADPTVVHGPQDLGATRVRSGCRRGRTAPPLMTTCNPRTTSFVPVINPDGHLDQSKVETALSYPPPPSHPSGEGPGGLISEGTHVRRQSTVGLPGPAGAEGQGRSCPVEADSSGCPAS